jgi:hypothetical protein
MSVEQLETTIAAMSARERAKLARWFDNHRHELIPEVATAQQREVLTRLAETEKNPASLLPFETSDLDCMILEAAHAHNQKAPAGRG